MTKLKNILYVAIGTFFLGSSDAEASVGEKATAIGGSIGAMTTLVLQIAAFVGVCVVFWGLAGFLKNRNNGGGQEGAKDHLIKMGIGAAMFCIPAIILMLTTTADVAQDAQSQTILGG